MAMLSKWCPTCREETLPMDNGTCGFCGALIERPFPDPEIMAELRECERFKPLPSELLQVLAQQPKNGGGRPAKTPVTSTVVSAPTLAELDVTKREPSDKAADPEKPPRKKTRRARPRPLRQPTMPPSIDGPDLESPDSSEAMEWARAIGLIPDRTRKRRNSAARAA